MATKLPVPEDFCILPGDKSGLAVWKRSEHADGYVLDYYRTDAPDVRIKRIYTQIPRKNIRGLKNGVEYFGVLTAFYYDDGQEVLGKRSNRFYFVPITHVLTAPKTICLEEGETRQIEWDFENTIPHVTFESEDTSIAVVDEDGAITGYNEGSVTVTLTSDWGESADIEVLVSRRLSRDHVRNTTLMFTGDLMCPPKTQRMCSDGGYDFTPIFTDSVKKELSKADYAAGMLRTMCDDSSPYENELPILENGNANYNTPSTFLDAIKDAGFKGVFTATDHNGDCGLTGLMNTRRKAFRAGLNHIGSLGDNPVIRVINGIRFAFIGLSQKYGPSDNEITQNPGEVLGRYSEDYFEELVAKAEEKRADQIIVLMNWGERNNRLVTSKQRVTAQFLAEAGADVILGSGPHVMQAYEEFTTSDGRSVPCLYSMGNFYSGMNELYENQVGCIASITVGEDSSSYSCRLSMIPTIISVQNSLTVVSTLEPIVTAAKRRAYDHLHYDYPEILFSSVTNSTLSMQGLDTMSILCDRLDCTCDYSPYDIEHLKKLHGEYLLLGLQGFAAYDDRSKRLAEYISGLSDIFPGERVILVRQSCPNLGVVDGEVVEIYEDRKLSHALYDMEEYVIETIHPIVIDISEYYFRDMSLPAKLVYEEGFYEHLIKIIHHIIYSHTRQFYYNERDNAIWINRVIKYHSSIKSSTAVRRMLLNRYDAADILVSEEGIDFITTYRNELLTLKNIHAELAFVQDVFADNPDAGMLVTAANVIWNQIEEG